MGEPQLLHTQVPKLKHARTHTHIHTRARISKNRQDPLWEYTASQREPRGQDMEAPISPLFVCWWILAGSFFQSIKPHTAVFTVKDTNHTGSVTSLFKQASFTNLRRDQICVYWIISLSFSKHALSSDAKKYTFLFLQKVNFQTLLQNRIIETYKSHCCFLTHSTLIINSCDMIVVLIWYHLSPQNWNSTAGTYTTNKWPGNVHWEPSWDFYMD